MKPCICHDDGVGPVTHEACPQHGNSIEAQQLKSAFEEVERHSLLLKGPGPWSAEEDENGVVHLKDGTGASRVLMARETYDALRNQRLEKQRV